MPFRIELMFYLFHYFERPDYFITGAFNMGGSPIPTVTKIKNLVYMNHTVEGETKTQPRDDYLGECILKFIGENCDDVLIVAAPCCAR